MTRVSRHPVDPFLGVKHLRARCLPECSAKLLPKKDPRTHAGVCGLKAKREDRDSQGHGIACSTTTPLTARNPDSVYSAM